MAPPPPEEEDEKKKKKKQQAPQKAGEVSKPRPKPFRVQAHIIDVKDIKPQPGILPDVVVTVTVSGYSTKYTQVVRQTTEASFGAFFEWKTDLDFEEFHAAALQFRVLNANTSSKMEILGMYDLKLSQIRKQSGGEYFFTWLALYANPSEYVTELQGALRVSVAVVSGTADPPTHTTLEEEEAREDDNPLVLMPHLVRRRSPRRRRRDPSVVN